MSGGALDAGAIVGRMDLALDGWKASVKQVKDDQQSLAGFALRHKQGIQDLGKSFTIAGGVMVGALGLAAKGAADAAETTSKFGVIFEPVADKANESLELLANGYGMSHNAAREMLSGTGDLLTGLGMSSQAALDLSTETQKLAVDLASFQNYAGGATGASDALTKGMLGEREMLKGLGIVITEEMVKEELFAQGKSKLTGLELTQAKAQATLLIATRQSKNAVGDFARTQDSLCNQSRILDGKLADLKNTIGDNLLPVIKNVVTHLTAATTKVGAWVKENPELARTLTLVAAGVGGILLVGGPLLMALPKLVEGFGLVKTAIAGVSLTSVALTATIAFAVVEVTKLINTLKDLRSAKEYEAEAGFRAAEANTNLGNKLREAADAAGITRAEFIKLTEKYGDNNAALAMAIKHGEFGVAMQSALAKVGAEHAAVKDRERAAVENQTKSEQDNTAAKAAAKKAAEEYTSFLNTLGIYSEQQLKEESIKLERAERDLIAAHEAGKISIEKYAAGMVTLTDEAKKYGLTLNTKVLPEHREFPELLDASAGKMEDASWEADRYGAVLKRLGGKTIDETKVATRLLIAEQGLINELFKAGKISGGDYTEMMDKLQAEIRGLGAADPEVKASQEEYKSGWEGVFTDLSRSLGSTFQTFVETWSWDKIVNGKINFKPFFSGLWGDVKKSFFTLVGDMASKWSISMLTDMISPTKKVGEALTKNVGGAVSGVGTTVGTVGSSIGTTITTLGTSIASVITSLAGAIGTGIVAIATGIGTAIVTLAEAISVAATTLAAAAPSLIIVGAIALGLMAGFKAIEGLIGGGGGNGDGMGRVVERQDRFLAGWDPWHVDMIEIAAFQQGQNDHRADQLDNLAGCVNTQGGNIVNAINESIKTWGSEIAVKVALVASALSKLPQAANGAISTQPQLMMVHGTPQEPEYIIPQRDLGRWAAGIQVSAPSSAGSLEVNLNGPLIQTAGVSRSDLERAGETLFSIIKVQAKRANLRFQNA